MTELLALILSDAKHFFGTILLMACTGLIVSCIVGMIAQFIKGKP